MLLSRFSNGSLLFCESLYKIFIGTWIKLFIILHVFSNCSLFDFIIYRFGEKYEHGELSLLI